MGNLFHWKCWNKEWSELYIVEIGKNDVAVDLASWKCEDKVRLEVFSIKNVERTYGRWRRIFQMNRSIKIDKYLQRISIFSRILGCVGCKVWKNQISWYEFIKDFEYSCITAILCSSFCIGSSNAFRNRAAPFIIKAIKTTKSKTTNRTIKKSNSKSDYS